MITDDRKRLADKILKLLALASSTSFDAEAETARRMADELMRTHNISLGPGKPPQDAIERRRYVPFAKGMKWEGIIVGSLADLCSCYILFWHKTLDRYLLVGAIGNLDMLEYMISEVNRQRIRAWLAHKASGNPDSFNKFCFGFAQALQSKIRDIVDANAVSATCDRFRLWYEQNVGPVGESHNLSQGKASSEAGLKAGEKASLHRGTLGEAHKRIGPPRTS